MYQDESTVNETMYETIPTYPVIQALGKLNEIDSLAHFHLSASVCAICII